ncbi:MAG: Dabb family protein [Prosthecobacter sp.]
MQKSAAYPSRAMLHNVYFWLKPDLTSEQRALFESELKRLPQISYLAHGFVGKPADTEPRPVTDHSFSFSLSLLFKNMQDHDFYQKECPDHQRFVDTCKTFWDRVVVYDSSPLS